MSQYGSDPFGGNQASGPPLPDPGPNPYAQPTGPNPYAQQGPGYPYGSGGLFPPPEPPKKKMSGGAITGIVIGAVVLLLLIAGGVVGGIYYFNQSGTPTAAAPSGSASPGLSGQPSGSGQPNAGQPSPGPNGSGGPAVGGPSGISEIQVGQCLRQVRGVNGSQSAVPANCTQPNTLRVVARFDATTNKAMCKGSGQKYDFTFTHTDRVQANSYVLCLKTQP
jgi:hypothetical protein